jgi:hypothetical protein
MHSPGAASATGSQRSRGVGLARQVMFSSVTSSTDRSARSPLWRWGRTAMRSSSTSSAWCPAHPPRAPRSGGRLERSGARQQHHRGERTECSSGRHHQGGAGDAVISGATGLDGLVMPWVICIWMLRLAPMRALPAINRSTTGAAKILRTELRTTSMRCNVSIRRTAPVVQVWRPAFKCTIWRAGMGRRSTRNQHRQHTRARVVSMSRMSPEKDDETRRIQIAAALSRHGSVSQPVDPETCYQCPGVICGAAWYLIDQATVSDKQCRSKPRTGMRRACPRTLARSARPKARAPHRCPAPSRCLHRAVGECIAIVVGYGQWHGETVNWLSRQRPHAIAPESPQRLTAFEQDAYQPPNVGIPACDLSRGKNASY